MAHRGISEGASEAFELFLDTISNTFGGVLFIALLVCIMLQMTPSLGGGSQTGVDAVTAAKQQAQLASLQAGIADLQKVQARQAEQLKSLVGDLANQGLLVEFAELSRQEQEELAMLLETTSQAAKRKSELINLRLLLERLRAENRSYKDRIEKAKAKPGEHISLPEAKSTNKKQMALMVTHGRACFANRFDATGKKHVWDDSQVVVEEATATVVARPGQGIRVQPGPAFAAELKKKLAQYDPASHYFAVAVWPDSWSEGAMVRDLLIAAKFEYNLLLMKEDELIGITDEQTGTDVVQN